MGLYKRIKKRSKKMKRAILIMTIMAVCAGAYGQGISYVYPCTYFQTNIYLMDDTNTPLRQRIPTNTVVTVESSLVSPVSDYHINGSLKLWTNRTVELWHKPAADVTHTGLTLNANGEIVLNRFVTAIGWTETIINYTNTLPGTMINDAETDQVWTQALADGFTVGADVSITTNEFTAELATLNFIDLASGYENDFSMYWNTISNGFFAGDGSGLTNLSLVGDGAGITNVPASSFTEADPVWTNAAQTRLDINMIVATNQSVTNVLRGNFEAGVSTTVSGNNGANANGYETTASGDWGANANGRASTASGDASTALGYNADASNDYSFVWSDGTVGGSVGERSFTIYATNGLHLREGAYYGNGLNITNINPANIAGPGGTFTTTNPCIGLTNYTYFVSGQAVSNRLEQN